MAFYTEIKDTTRYLHPQYSDKTIEAISGISVGGSILSLIPQKPFADETWASGGRIRILTPEGNGYSEYAAYDITEYDPGTGEIFCYIPGNEAGLIERIGDKATQIQYRPFNYAYAIDSAYQRAEAAGVDFSGIEKKVLGDYRTGEAIPLDASGSTVDSIWDKPWAILWGPPGTGKTESVSLKLAEKIASNSLSKVLVVCPTNRAVDEITMRTAGHLYKKGALFNGSACMLFRGGGGAGKEIYEHRVYSRCLGDASYAKKTAETRKKISELRQKRDDLKGRGDFNRAANISAQLKALMESLPDETEYVLKKGSAKAVFVTHYKALTLVAKGFWKLQKVVIDEAGMVSRAITAAVSSLAPTALLAGDPKQIGPICIPPVGLDANIRKWLASSGLSHLHSAKESLAVPNVCILRTQYRMAPSICRLVSLFTYDGILYTGAKPAAYESEPPCGESLPPKRASTVVIDQLNPDTPESAPRPPESGRRGWERPLSAGIAAELALDAAERAESILIMTPYNAQVQAIRKAVKKAFPKALHQKVKVGTIHRHQGAEADVVILDAVNGMRSWSDRSEKHMLLNVAASRARRHFILLASGREIRLPVLNEFVALLPKTPYIKRGDSSQQLLIEAQGAEADEVVDALPVYTAPINLGEEIAGEVRAATPTREQAEIIERRKGLGHGHFLVRGVAGSGKTLILSHWAVRVLQYNPKARILITYFNKSLKGLIRKMLQVAAATYGYSLKGADIHLVNASALNRLNGEFDAVFIDEAQDLDPEKLLAAFRKCREKKINNQVLRDFVMFHDDSQNIYGRKNLEEFRKHLLSVDHGRYLKEEFTFKGRTAVLRETHRSTRNIIGFAFNLALDPQNLCFKDQSGLLGFMNINELSKEGLIQTPEATENGIYEINFCQQQGVEPVIIESERRDLFSPVVSEVDRLQREEKVAPGDILVITLRNPEPAATALRGAGIKAEAFCMVNNNTADFPGGEADFVRCTTVFSAKGHEAPVIFYVVDENMWDLRWLKELSPEEHSKARRCMLYVGCSRAMKRLYFVTIKGTRLCKAAQEYSKAVRLTLV